MKTLLYMILSADGFISQPNDAAPLSETAWKLYYAFVKERGNLVLGRRTYEQMRDDGSLKLLGEIFLVALSHNPVPRVVTASTPEEAVQLITEKGFTEAVIGGGSRTNTSFLDPGLLDELCLDTDHVLFGAGFPLFAQPTVLPNLKLLSSEINQGIVRTHYEVLK